MTETQREIKFRAWDGESNKMIGPELNDADSKQIEFSIQSNGDVRIHTRLGDYTQEGTDSNILRIMQFTGLTDKNGTPMYEGDIVQYTWPAYRLYDGVYVIIYKKDRFCLSKKVELPSGAISVDMDNSSPPGIIEIIGNIYENPELLK